MKTTLFSLLLFFATGAFAQNVQYVITHDYDHNAVPKNFCYQDTSCMFKVLTLLPEYKLTGDTSARNLKVYFYKNATGDKVNFYFTNTGTFKSIIASYPAMKIIYNNYYGRDVDLKKTSGELYRFTIDGKEHSFDLSNNSDGTWFLRIY